jgi:oligopeptide transport system ATP-binding protein
VLTVDRLSVAFHTPHGRHFAVRDVSLQIHRGEAVGIIGESGCGKSALVRSVMGLYPSSYLESPVPAPIQWNGQSLTQLSGTQWQAIRGKKIGMIFQEPLAALDPLWPVGKQVQEVIRSHAPDMTTSDLEKKALALLQLVRIPDPEVKCHQYPHELSGGLRQRIGIALAMACDPELLIADEPTTALDVTVQAQILDLIVDLQKQRQMALLLITHDLGLIWQVCQRVVVMYAGEIVEEGPVLDVLRHPLHPYTQGLIASLPKLTTPIEKPLKTIDGHVPPLHERHDACPFASRCPYVQERCRTHKPPAVAQEKRRASCWLLEGGLG